jgi:ubiquinone/menaquinone biosynthesis C-methylase UbiE
MKINIGSGYKRIEGFLNVDDDPLVEPEYLVNLEEAKLPFEDNSIEEIRAHHIFEHINNFIPLMKELHRVAKHGCILDILVPHHQHDVFYGDPTHVRPITVSTMYLFSKKFCQDHAEKYGSYSGIAQKYNIDFDMVHYEFEYDQFYAPMLTDFFARKEQNKVSEQEDFAIQRLLREATNVAIHTKIIMAVVKDE